MSEIEQLVIVQGFDSRIHAMEKELRDIPARKQFEEQRLSEHQARVIAAEGEVKNQQAAIKKVELESLAREERITKLRGQQMLLKTNKEFTAMEQEIKAARDSIHGLEDEELVLMERLESARQQLALDKKALAEEAAAVKTDVVALDERAARVQAELDTVRASRQHAASSVAPGWLARYETVLSRKEIAVVRVEDGICGGCHMQLPPSVVHEARRRATMVFCDYCGRMLG